MFMTGQSPPSPPPDLPLLVRRGTGAVFAAQVASQLVSLLALACLARLVPADAFGVIGIALPLVMLPRMAATLGFSTAAVADAQGDDALLSGLFWRTLAWSLAAAVVTSIAGPLFAWLYAMPQLALVAPALAGATLLNALSVVHLAVLERRMRLRTTAVVRLTAQTIAAAVAVICAWLGYGVWSLVMQHVAEFVVLACIVWAFGDWRPGFIAALPAETRRFGGYYSLSSLLFYAAQNIDKLLLAAWLGSSPRAAALVGMYAQAYNLMMRPVYFVHAPMASVMLPTLSRVQHDHADRADWTERFYSVTALLLFPAGIGLWIVAGDVMQILAPDWPEAGVFLAALAPIILAQGFMNLATVSLAAARRSDVLCFAAVVQLLLTAQAVWGGAWFGQSDYYYTTTNVDPNVAPYRAALGGAVGVSLATTLVILVPYMVFAFRITGVPLERFFRALRIALPAAAAMGGAVYLVHRILVRNNVTEVPRLLICIGCGALIYGGLTFIQWGRRPRLP